MIDRESAANAAEALSLAIASIFEERHDSAVTAVITLEDYGPVARVLQAAGEDVVVLARALQILIRWAEPPE